MTYERELVAEYDKLIDSGFVFYFAPADFDHLDQGVSWSRAEEMASATKLFTGQPMLTPGGQPRPPVTQIAVTLTPESPSWDANVPAAFSGTVHRRYTVDMVLTQQGGGAIHVLGVRDFYVAAVQVDGQTRYKLRYWVDLCAPSTQAFDAGRADPALALVADAPICWSAFKSGEF